MSKTNSECRQPSNLETDLESNITVTKLNTSQNYKEQSKERLERILEKKILTTGIGALDRLEKDFSFLWKTDNEVKDEAMFQIYKKCRQQILELTYKQIDNMKKELEFHTVELNRYKIEIPVSE